VIFLDLGLPDQSGLDVLLSLRHHGMTQYTPIYMLSGHITNEMHQQCMAHGADGAYTKPMEKAALADLLESLQSCAQ
jgi:CheY-like chemotaxis protein